MGLLKEKDKKKVKKVFEEIEKDVKVVMFTQETECQQCEMTRTLLEEVSGLSDKLSLEVNDFVSEADVAKKYRVDKIPAIILIGDRDYGIHFYGLPSGYEFNVLIGDIIDVGKRNPGLNKEVTAALAKVDRPVHLQVLVSPT